MRRDNERDSQSGKALPFQRLVPNNSPHKVSERIVPYPVFQAYCGERQFRYAGQKNMYYVHCRHKDSLNGRCNEVDCPIWNDTTRVRMLEEPAEINNLSLRDMNQVLRRASMEEQFKPRVNLIPQQLENTDDESKNTSDFGGGRVRIKRRPMALRVYQRPCPGGAAGQSSKEGEGGGDNSPQDYPGSED